MLIEDDIKRIVARENSGDASRHLEAVRNLLGLREQATLSQILKDQTLREKGVFNLALASLAVVMVQYGTSAYLFMQRRDLIRTKEGWRLASISLRRSKSNIALFYQGLRTGTDLTENAQRSIIYRIGEQQDSFLKDPSLTIKEIQFFNICHILTSSEVIIHPGDLIMQQATDGIRKDYARQKGIIPHENFLRAVSFPNELRTAVNLEPLK